MSLLDQESNESIPDCVGKTGFCEYVTDPMNNKLHYNKNLFPENGIDLSDVSEIENENENEKILKSSCDNKKTDDLNKMLNSVDDILQNFNTPKDDLTFKTLLMILNKLDDIERKLK